MAGAPTLLAEGRTPALPCPFAGPGSGTDDAAAGMDGEADTNRDRGTVIPGRGHPAVGSEQLRTLLAAGIVRVLDDRKPTVVAAGEETRVAAMDFPRVRGRL